MKTIAPYYHGIDLPPRYAPFIRERNGNLARRYAQALGMDSAEEARDLKIHYPLLPIPYLRTALPLQKPCEFYGARIRHTMHGTKAILQKPLPNSAVPSHLPKELGAVQDLSLPGHVAFNEDQAVTAYHGLRREGYSVRFKNPEESDGNGQKRIESEAHLRALLGEFRHLFQQEIGVVLEVDLSPLPGKERVDTYSVGRVLLPNGRQLHFAGQQVDLPNRDGFGGVNMVVGYQAAQVVMAAALPRAVAHGMTHLGEGFDQLQKHLTASRLSVDLLHGYAGGQEHIGICDLTVRVGGTCPGLAEALLALKGQEDRLARSEVKLHWEPQEDLPIEGFRYINRPELIIAASSHIL